VPALNTESVPLAYFCVGFALELRDVHGNFRSVAGGHFHAPCAFHPRSPIQNQQGGTGNGLTAHGSGRWRVDASKSCSPISTGAAGLLMGAAAAGGASHDVARWEGARGMALLGYGLGTPRCSANARASLLHFSASSHLGR
jgi:hypothetical protein